MLQHTTAMNCIYCAAKQKVVGEGLNVDSKASFGRCDT